MIIIWIDEGLNDDWHVVQARTQAVSTSVTAYGGTVKHVSQFGMYCTDLTDEAIERIRALPEVMSVYVVAFDASGFLPPRQSYPVMELTCATLKTLAMALLRLDGMKYVWFPTVDYTWYGYDIRIHAGYDVEMESLRRMEALRGLTAENRDVLGCSGHYHGRIMVQGMPSAEEFLSLCVLHGLLAEGAYVLIYGDGHDD